MQHFWRGHVGATMNFVKSYSMCDHYCFIICASKYNLFFSFIFANFPFEFDSRLHQVDENNIDNEKLNSFEWKILKVQWKIERDWLLIQLIAAVIVSNMYRYMTVRNKEAHLTVIVFYPRTSSFICASELYSINVWQNNITNWKQTKQLLYTNDHQCHCKWIWLPLRLIT